MPPGSYKNPPIEEALCEFRFAPSLEWDPTIPGKLAADDRIKETYDGKARQQNVLSTNISLPAQGQAGGPTVALNQGLGKLQLPTQDGKRLLGVGADVLSVHTLRPYDGWGRFRPRIETGLAAYRDVAGAMSVVRLGVRYINRITIPEENFDLAQYFVATAPAVPGLPHSVGGFFHRDEYVYEDGIKLIKTFASTNSEPGSSVFLLDLDVVWDSKPEKPISDALELADDLHAREGRAFEALIQDPLRRIFDA